MDLIRIHCKKDFLGMIDIRDYIVKSAIEEGKSISVTCGSYPGKSVYSPQELENPERVSRDFTAQYGDIKSYRLYSYPWKFE